MADDGKVTYHLQRHRFAGEEGTPGPSRQLGCGTGFGLDVIACIEGFYNSRRRQSALGYKPLGIRFARMRPKLAVLRPSRHRPPGNDALNYSISITMVVLQPVACETLT